MKYFSDVEKQNKELTEAREFLELSENIVLYDNEVIEEGFFGKLFGSMFKRCGEICSAISKGLEAEKGKRWKTFVDNFFNDNDGEKAIKSEKAADTIKRIEKTRSEMVKNKAIEEKESYGYAVNLAFAATSEHNDDDEYKEEITKKIAEWRKLGGKDADKIINAAREAANKGKGGENTEGDSGEPKEEEIKKDDQAVNKSTKTLGGNSERVKNAISPVVKTESKIDLLNEIFEGDESNGEKKSNKLKEKMGDTLWTFRSKYLYASDPQIKNKFSKEQREIHKKTVINFVSAMSAMKENIKGVTGDEIKEFISALLQFPNINEIFK